MLTTGLEILRVLAEADQPLTATAIAGRVGLHVSNVSRTLRVLAAAMIRDRPNDRGTIFQTMYSGSLHLAVVLYNKRGFRYFGNMVFRWLQMEGEGVMTDTLGGVLAGNIRSGI